MRENLDSGVFDRLLEHAHVAASFFVIMSGFGMHWGQSTFSPFAQPKGSEAEGALAGAKRVGGNLLGWYAGRLGRIIATTWVTMLLTLIVEAALYKMTYPAGSVFSCLAFVEFWQIGRSDYDAFPAWMRCPNTPAWYIAALVPCWLLFPLFLPILRACNRLPSGWPLWMLLLLLCGISHLPVQALIKEDPPPKQMPNYMMYFPPAQFSDFFAGAVAAALAKAHQPWFQRWLAAPATPAASWRARLQQLWPTFFITLLVDSCVLAMGFVIFQRVAVGDRAVNATVRRADASLYHSATLPIALFLYSSVVSGGKGFSTAFCRWPALVSLGRYALYAYLFQMPYAEFYAWAVSGGSHLELQQPNVPPWRAFHTDSFTLYILSLWLLCGLYAEFIETPLVDALPALWRCCRRVSGADLEKLRRK